MLLPPARRRSPAAAGRGPRSCETEGRLSALTAAPRQCCDSKAKGSCSEGVPESHVHSRSRMNTCLRGHLMCAPVVALTMGMPWGAQGPAQAGVPAGPEPGHLAGVLDLARQRGFRTSWRGPARATYDASALVHMCTASKPSSGVGCKLRAACRAATGPGAGGRASASCRAPESADDRTDRAASVALCNRGVCLARRDWLAQRRTSNDWEVRAAVAKEPRQGRWRPAR